MIKTLPNYHSLSRRIVLQFCLFTLVLSIVYGLISLVLMYTLEDSYIEKGIHSEAQYLNTEYQKTGVWPSPISANIQLHFSKSSFPEDMRDKSLEEPKRVEFGGDQGRHYHLYTFVDHDQVYLLAEVSSELMVRPIRGGIIQFLTVSSLIVSTIACLIAWLVGRKTASPLKQLAELVDGVEPENVPSRFAQQFPNNEVGVLAYTLEQTFNRIAQSLEREKHFTRDVSHELRTPLAVIKNACELFQNHFESSDKEQQILNRISHAAEQIDKTVHTLLMLAREEHTTAQKEPVSLMPLVEQSVLDNSALLQGKQVEVIIDDNCHTSVHVQSGMLKVLLDNVLSNAFQYTDSGEVKVSYEQGSLVVEDTGPGIDLAISDDVTSPGVKGSQSTGFGFGLSIVKRLCEHQDWKLKVTSDKGTTISVLLT